MMGKVFMSGIVPLLTKPITGILAADLAVGSTVKLMEGGTAVEYLVVNQGIPGNSSLYDASCDGTWLLRKDCHSQRQWNTSNVNTYANSAINTWLNGEFFNSLGSVEQSAIKQVKIPYGGGNGSATINSGANGLSVKAFLLSGYEAGFSVSTDQYFPVDGAKLSYFESGLDTSALNKRIAYLNGSSVSWWVRSPYTGSADRVWLIRYSGTYGNTHPSDSYSIRPAFILPSNALFDETTLILKGVA